MLWSGYNPLGHPELYEEVVHGAVHAGLVAGALAVATLAWLGRLEAEAPRSADADSGGPSAEIDRAKPRPRTKPRAWPI